MILMLERSENRASSRNAAPSVHCVPQSALAVAVQQGSSGRPVGSWLGNLWGDAATSGGRGLGAPLSLGFSVETCQQDTIDHLDMV